MGRWTEAAQAEFAVQFYSLAFGHPSVVSITWWRLADASIWLEGGGCWIVTITTSRCTSSRRRCSEAEITSRDGG
jgi:hypothetical protein